MLKPASFENKLFELVEACEGGLVEVAEACIAALDDETFGAIARDDAKVGLFDVGVDGGQVAGEGYTALKAGLVIDEAPVAVVRGFVGGGGLGGQQ